MSTLTTLEEEILWKNYECSTFSWHGQFIFYGFMSMLINYSYIIFWNYLFNFTVGDWFDYEWESNGKGGETLIYILIERERE